MLKIPIDPPVKCDLCPRLVEFRNKYEISNPDWFNGAVPSFGDKKGRLLITGLAPGLKGANRTGRPFTGDWAGDLLFPTLLKFGFAKGIYKAAPNDSLELVDTLINNSVKCVPPQNKPIAQEIKNCRPFLKAQFEDLKNLKVVICLGSVSHDATLKMLGLKKVDYKFIHNAQHDIGNGVTLIDSYHCSRYNTNTRRLTVKMFEAVFKNARYIIGATI